MSALDFVPSFHLLAVCVILQPFPHQIVCCAISPSLLPPSVSRGMHEGPFTPSASTSVDGRRRASTDVDALGVNPHAFSHVFHIGVDARLRPSTSVARVYGRRRT